MREAPVETKFRCGDTVHHAPSDERWTVAFADYETGDLAYCGWPEGLAQISDCTLVTSASDDEHARLVDKVIESGGMRGRRAQRLYRPIGTAEAIVMSTAFRAFRNALCLLRGIDMPDLVTAGVLSTQHEFAAMEADPVRFFLRLDEKRAAALWFAIQARMPADLRAEGSVG